MAGYAGLGVEQNYEGGVWSLRSSGGGSPGRESRGQSVKPSTAPQRQVRGPGTCQMLQVTETGVSDANPRFLSYPPTPPPMEQHKCSLVS